MRVVPKESERRADQSAAENREFADLRQMLDIEIGGKSGVAGDVSEHGERARGDHHAADGETIEAIGQIHRVR